MKRHLVLLTAALGCGSLDAPVATPPDAFAFAVFGDGPYQPWQQARFDRLIADANAHDLAWFLHVGDILDHQCADAVYHDRLDRLNTLAMPVIYTPGDNEWTDCPNADPLDRLAALRRVFFAEPGMSIGGRPMPLTVQDAYPEHARWTLGGVTFATVHMVGSSNALEVAPEESAVRTDSALAWMERAFEAATAASHWAVVLAFHGNPGFGERRWERGYAEFIAALERLTAGFDGQVLVIHGDWHDLTIDEPLPGIRRLQTYGSPTIGWVHVTVDTVARAFSFAPRAMPRRWLLW